ncbi:MAG: DUF421 domain-containing protein [Candidatus Borkfalkiaceae bacterium]|nr:DUF421 domain-containing protein [Clostridia bacterium]MDY6223160.1 DUF421 domain-containing protein [Christensenellaceae bacterium]
MESVWRVFVFSVSSFVFLFAVMKILGKKQIAELSFIDYVVGISIGSIAAEWSTAMDEPFYHYVIAISVYCLFTLSLDFIERKKPFRKFLKGEVIPIIENGEFNYENLKKSKLDVEDVLAMARDKDIFDVRDIAYALFETTGKLSVLPKSAKSPLVAEDMQIKKEPASLTNYVIVHGKPQYKVMRQTGVTADMLFEKLNIQSENDLNEILLAAYDEKEKSFTVYRK